MLYRQVTARRSPILHAQIVEGPDSANMPERLRALSSGLPRAGCGSAAASGYERQAISRLGAPRHGRPRPCCRVPGGPANLKRPAVPLRAFRPHAGGRLPHARSRRSRRWQGMRSARTMMSYCMPGARLDSASSLSRRSLPATMRSASPARMAAFGTAVLSAVSQGRFRPTWCTFTAYRETETPASALSGRSRGC